MNCIKRWLTDENGEDMIEYGLLASFISIAALLTVRAIGPLVDAMYERVRSVIS